MAYPAINGDMRNSNTTMGIQKPLNLPQRAAALKIKRKCHQNCFWIELKAFEKSSSKSRKLLFLKLRQKSGYFDGVTSFFEIIFQMQMRRISVSKKGFTVANGTTRIVRGFLLFLSQCKLTMTITTTIFLLSKDVFRIYEQNWKNNEEKG